MTTVLNHEEFNSELCEKARHLGGHTTQAETIEKALEVYLYYLQKQANLASQQLAILDEFGKIDYYEDHDYKNIRNLK
jgi:hypothetical protein